LNTNTTHIQYINHTSLLISNGEDILLTNPWYDKPAFGNWLPAPPPCIHPAYFASLAENNKDNFYILISSPDDDHCDDDFLRLFPKEIKIIIPKYESPWFRRRIENIGFNNIFEIGKRSGVSNIKYRLHGNGTISIQTKDALIIHSSKNHKFSEECIISINKHIEDHRADTGYLKLDQSKILLAAQINISQNDYPFNYSDYDNEEKYKEILTKSANQLYISAINMKANYLLCYGGHSNLFIESNKIGGFKNRDFYKQIVKLHLVDKINYLDIIPGDKFDFENIQGLFGDCKYTELNLKNQSKNFYKDQ